MQINLESTEKSTITSYDATQIVINQVAYTSSFILNPAGIITRWLVTDLSELTPAHFADIVALNPEVLIVGHNQLNQYFPPSLIHYLAQQQIGVECMPVGAACRTFNVLLSENRNVVAAFLL